MISKNRPFVRPSDLAAVLFAKSDAIATWERRFAELCGARYALAYPYNRVGIYAALEANGIKDRDVLLPAYSCVVVAAAVICSGNRPVFVDIDPVTYNLDVADARRKVTSSTAAALPTLMYGAPADVHGLRAALPAGTLIIEDAALATPGFAYTPPLLDGSDVAIFSMDLNKVTTAVNGAMLLFNDREQYERLSAWRERELKPAPETKRLMMGAATALFLTAYVPPVYRALDLLRTRSRIVADQVRAYSLARIEMSGDWRTQASASQAALGLRQLEVLDTIVARRKAVDDVYREALQGALELTLPPEVPFPYSHFTLRVPNRDARRFRERLYERGIECGRTLDYCLPDMPLFAQCEQAGSCPESSRAAAEIVNLPNYPDLSVERARFIARTVREIAT